MCFYKKETFPRQFTTTITSEDSPLGLTAQSSTTYAFVSQSLVRRMCLLVLVKHVHAEEGGVSKCNGYSTKERTWRMRQIIATRSLSYRQERVMFVSGNSY